MFIGKFWKCTHSVGSYSYEHTIHIKMLKILFSFIVITINFHSAKSENFTGLQFIDNKLGTNNNLSPSL